MPSLLLADMVVPGALLPGLSIQPLFLPGVPFLWPVLQLQQQLPGISAMLGNLGERDPWSDLEH